MEARGPLPDPGRVPAPTRHPAAAPALHGAERFRRPPVARLLTRAPRGGGGRGGGERGTVARGPGRQLSSALSPVSVCGVCACVGRRRCPRRPPPPPPLSPGLAARWWDAWLWSESGARLQSFIPLRRYLREGPESRLWPGSVGAGGTAPPPPLRCLQRPRGYGEAAAHRARGLFVRAWTGRAVFPRGSPGCAPRWDLRAGRGGGGWRGVCSCVIPLSSQPFPGEAGTPSP